MDYGYAADVGEAVGDLMTVLEGRQDVAVRLGAVAERGGVRWGNLTGRHRDRSRCIGSSRCFRGLLKERVVVVVVVVVVRHGSYPVLASYLWEDRG